MIRPNLRVEKSLLRDGHRIVVGCDEVGRGALGGPVSVGVLAVDGETGRVPSGLADSKLLSAARRQQLVPVVQRWSLDHAVGHASAAEIDRFGIMVGLRLAAMRGLSELQVLPDVVLLDGSHDWLSPRLEQAELFADEPSWPKVDVPAVLTRVKADLHCASVSGASVLAKTRRDALMVEMARDYPQFGWDENKGYASPEHLACLKVQGPCAEHRRSWRLPGVAPAEISLRTSERETAV